MTQTLALKYRPATFDDMVGQAAVSLPLQQMVRKSDVPYVMLFAGPRGTGKTSAGRILAAAVNCEYESAPCNECESCQSIMSGRSLAVLEIDAASHGNVEAVRKLCEMLRCSVGVKRRVVLLDECHAMTTQAYDSFLKTLEEPEQHAPGSGFVLLTTEIRQVPDPVISRCVPFYFRRVPPKVIMDRLAWVCERENVSVEPAMLRAISEAADGGVRDALMSLDQALRAGAHSYTEYAELSGDVDFAPELLQAMVSGDRAKMFAATDRVLSLVGDYSLVQSKLVACLTDVQVLHALGGDPGGVVTAQGEALEVRRALMGKVDTDRATAALKVLWDLETKVSRAADRRSVLSLAVSMMSEALRAKAVVPATTGSNGHSQVMTLDQMKSAVHR